MFHLILLTVLIALQEHLVLSYKLPQIQHLTQEESNVLRDFDATTLPGTQLNRRTGQEYLKQGDILNHTCTYRH